MSLPISGNAPTSVGSLLRAFPASHEPYGEKSEHPGNREIQQKKLKILLYLGDSVQAYPLCVVRCAMTHCVGPRCALCVVLWPLGCVVRCAMGHGCVVRCALGHAPRKTANVSQSLLLEQSRFCLNDCSPYSLFSLFKRVFVRKNVTR